MNGVQQQRIGSMAFLRKCIVMAPAFLLACTTVTAQGSGVRTTEHRDGDRVTLGLTNDLLTFRVVIDSGRIVMEMTTSPAGTRFETDGGFGMEIMWTDWQAPPFFNNAENPARFTGADFHVARWEIRELEKGEKELDLHLAGTMMQLLARRSYRLAPGRPYVRFGLALADTTSAGHFLQEIQPVRWTVRATPKLLNPGGFGQPVAGVLPRGGFFAGTEYPAADNTAEPSVGGLLLTCAQEMGERIGREWRNSEWVVLGLTPDADVRRHFFAYLDEVRVAPLRPYTLYNSWYDLRSAEYPKVPAANVMNEENVRRIIGLIERNMIRKHGIQLDAFVLDDGWDVYESDWMLRPVQFPNGLTPVAEELRKTKTDLGIWFGPTGGYSFRMKRVTWMKEHGYEVVGTTRNTAMLCLAGRKYGELFRKRTTDLVAQDGVRYFKWDGIQFSCSEPDHGHPVGIYSRRAVLESVIKSCEAVRRATPGVYLNITSGTWLSPWWVKYANQIWMQGQDYGYADVPSISPRDAAITYRDFVLYDDFRNRNWWFPIANLMTHGIIKGNLQMLGGTREPLEKFTNEVLLYFARGVSMWELYISPDILTDGEWDALGKAMHWAKDRFPILMSTEMTGGDPTKREPYGYLHFRGSRGVIAARNPWIERGTLRVELTTGAGLDAQADRLVLERVYPTHWVSPKLFRTGDHLELPLEGYETAVYEMYPLREADVPLLGDATYSVHEGKINVYEAGSEVTFLNPEMFTLGGGAGSIAGMLRPAGEPVTPSSIVFRREDGEPAIEISFTVEASVESATLSLLLTPDGGTVPEKPPVVLVELNGKTDTARTEEAEARSSWYSVAVVPGTHTGRVRVTRQDGAFKGTVAGWVVCTRRQAPMEVTYSGSGGGTRRPMPPLALPEGKSARNVKLGQARVE
jgi:hypothetical protein